MMEAANRKDDDFAFAKGTQVQENDDLVMVGAEAVKVITPIEMADEEQAANAVAVKGEVQPNEFRDSWAAVLFLIQFMGVVSVAIAYAPYISSQSDKDSSYFASEINDDDADDISGASIFLLFFISYGIAGFTTMGALSLMMRYSESLVKISFFFAPLSFAAVALLLLLAGDDTSMIFAIVALFMSVLMVCCWFFYKKHIPFAAANLRSALTALRLNSATYGFAFIFSLVSFVTMLIGLIAIAGVQAKADSEGKVLCSTLVDDDTVFVGEQAGVECDKNPPNPILLMTLFLCFYWTQQVVQNVVHVTTAGVVGSWWFTPMADPSCCSPTIISSLRRALTYSFGSICFGSLLVAMMQLLEQLARNARQNGRGGILLCVVQVSHPLSFIEKAQAVFTNKIHCFDSVSFSASVGTWNTSIPGHLSTLDSTDIPTSRLARM
jgi:hypothetical protein